MISGKFAISIHILTLLTKYPEDFLSSDYIAGSINLNPVLVRKEIANLKKHGVVESKEGKNGGTRLAKPASKITLNEIFIMTLNTVSFGFSKNKPNPKCPIGKNINANLDDLYTTLNQSIQTELEAITLENFSNNF